MVDADSDLSPLLRAAAWRQWSKPSGIPPVKAIRVQLKSTEPQSTQEKLRSEKLSVLWIVFQWVNMKNCVCRFLDFFRSLSDLLVIPRCLLWVSRDKCQNELIMTRAMKCVRCKNKNISLLSFSSSACSSLLLLLLPTHAALSSGQWVSVLKSRL